MLYNDDNSTDYSSSTSSADLQSEGVGMAQRQNYAFDAFVPWGFTFYLLSLLHIHFGRRIQPIMVIWVFKVLHLLSDLFWRNACIFSLNRNYS